MLFWHRDDHFSLIRVALGRSTAHSARPPARGEIEADILRILWDGPRDRFGIALALERQCGYAGGAESIEPTLRMLEDGDFITGREVDGRRVYDIAAPGSERLADHLEARSDTAGM
jgi:DNA-binding PadR family transcriptional regulator